MINSAVQTGALLVSIVAGARWRASQLMERLMAAPNSGLWRRRPELPSGSRTRMGDSEHLEDKRNKPRLISPHDGLRAA